MNHFDSLLALESVFVRTFIDKPTNSKSDEPTIRATRCYLEIEWPVNESLCAIIYAIPRTGTSAYIAACWETAFDELLRNLDSHTLETIVETWPTLATLLYNGINDKYREGALIRLEDADYGEMKWFVASVAGNISFDSEDDFFTDRTVDTIQVVMEKSMELMVELQERKPSIIRAVGKGIMAGLSAVAVGAIAVAFGIDPDDLTG
jgi:hypothetical protein